MVNPEQIRSFNNKLLIVKSDQRAMFQNVDYFHG